MIAGTEETTTGVIRLRGMQREGVLRYPVIAINDADTKHLFDNRYGTGQSTMDGIMRATNVLLAGRTVVVVRLRLVRTRRGLTSPWTGRPRHRHRSEPTRALEALMDGYRVSTLEDAAPLADIVVTVTGNINVVDRQHLAKLKDGAILANSGHFNDEINLTPWPN